MSLIVWLQSSSTDTIAVSPRTNLFLVTVVAVQLAIAVVDATKNKVFATGAAFKASLVERLSLKLNLLSSINPLTTLGT